MGETLLLFYHYMKGTARLVCAGNRGMEMQLSSLYEAFNKEDGFALASGSGHMKYARDPKL